MDSYEPATISSFKMDGCQGCARLSSHSSPPTSLLSETRGRLQAIWHFSQSESHLLAGSVPQGPARMAGSIRVKLEEKPSAGR